MLIHNLHKSAQTNVRKPQLRTSQAKPQGDAPVDVFPASPARATKGLRGAKPSWIFGGKMGT